MSIDGGHTQAVTAKDWRLAERGVLPGGLVALDDIFSHEWTGVIAGWTRYLAEGVTLVSFALVPNKLMLSTDAASVVEAAYKRRGVWGDRHGPPNSFSRAGWCRSDSVSRLCLLP